MSEGKVLTYLGIIIAVNAIFWNNIQTHWWLFFVISVPTLLVCLLLSSLEKRIIYSNHKWIDRIVYIFTKNDFNYSVKQKIVEYAITSKHEAKYNLSANICVIKPDEGFHYNGRYVWDQENPINITLKNPEKFSYKKSENLKWSNVDIYPIDSIPQAKTNYSIGFKLDNLEIKNLVKHSFLSCKVIEKIEKLKLVARVSPSLSPAPKATLEIQNHLGLKVAPDEEIAYDEATSSYSKTLSYPRKGRKYIIHWKYEENA